MLRPQVNNIIRKLYQISIREIHNIQPKILNKINRSLLQVNGSEASIFLQGLITNDIRLLDQGSDCIYTVFLNNKGRVMLDSIIYKWNETNTYLVECDCSASATLMKHLKLFRLKRKIEIADVSSDLTPLVLLTDDKPPDSEFYKHFKDPRLAELGYRLIAPANKSLEDLSKSISHDLNICEHDELYKTCRYKLGIGEGTAELPQNSCFPLEMNLDLLNGVSFTKGCYIGQELTARTFHTGVTRKRLMPLQFNKPLTQEFEIDLPIVNIKDQKHVGKLRGLYKSFGLGLMRVAETLKADSLTVGGQDVSVIKPYWWPSVDSKQRNQD